MKLVSRLCLFLFLPVLLATAAPSQDICVCPGYRGYKIRASVAARKMRIQILKQSRQDRVLIRKEMLKNRIHIKRLRRLGPAEV